MTVRETGFEADKKKRDMKCGISDEMNRYKPFAIIRVLQLGAHSKNRLFTQLYVSTRYAEIKF